MVVLGPAIHEFRCAQGCAAAGRLVNPHAQHEDDGVLMNCDTIAL
jgi:hypothetical protein